jgi:hypothetical protein
MPARGYELDEAVRKIADDVRRLDLKQARVRYGLGSGSTGDVGGGTPAEPLVTGIQGVPVDTDAATPADRDALIYDAGTGGWIADHVQAADVVYDPAASGLAAVQVQAAIDELDALLGSGAFLEAINGGGGTVWPLGNLGATEAIDTVNGNYQWGTLNANCTFTFATIADTAERWFTLELIEDGTGGWSPTWPGSVVWLGGTAPTHTTTAGTTTIYLFFTRNGGATWMGGQLGSGGTSPLTTKGDLYGYDTADARIPVGSNDTVLTADSTDAQGVAWKTLETLGHWEPLMDGGSPYAPLDDGTGTDWLFVWVP